MLQIIWDASRVGSSSPADQDAVSGICHVLALQFYDLDQVALRYRTGESEQGDVVDDQVLIVVGVDDDLGHSHLDSAVGVELVYPGDDAVRRGARAERHRLVGVVVGLFVSTCRRSGRR